MTVTAIEEITKTRSRVYLDDAFAFVLYKGELRKYHMETGRDVDAETVRELQTKILPKRARLRAMNLLKTGRYTEKQLLDKLLAGGYGQELAGDAVAYVKSYRYVDDRQYASDYIMCRMGRCSLREIEQKLFQKGIGRELFRAVLEELEADEAVPDEEAAVRRLMEKKHFMAAGNDEKEARRIYGYLCRKGFSPELVRRVMRGREEC